MRKISKIGLYIFVVVVIIIGVVLYYREVGNNNKDISIRIEWCKSNLSQISVALWAYCKDNDWRLPNSEHKGDPYFWVKPVTPYLLQNKEALYCPLDKTRNHPSSYIMDPKLAGKKLDELLDGTVLLKEVGYPHKNEVDLKKGMAFSKAAFALIYNSKSTQKILPSVPFYFEIKIIGVNGESLVGDTPFDICKLNLVKIGTAISFKYNGCYPEILGEDFDDYYLKMYGETVPVCPKNPRQQYIYQATDKGKNFVLKCVSSHPECEQGYPQYTGDKGLLVK